MYGPSREGATFFTHGNQLLGQERDRTDVTVPGVTETKIRELERVKVEKDGHMREAVSVRGTVNGLGGHPPRLVDDHKNEYKIETSI